jgi:hypothetical protein
VLLDWTTSSPPLDALIDHDAVASDRAIAHQLAVALFDIALAGAPIVRGSEAS